MSASRAGDSGKGQRVSVVMLETESEDDELAC